MFLVNTHFETITVESLNERQYQIKHVDPQQVIWVDDQADITISIGEYLLAYYEDKWNFTGGEVEARNIFKIFTLPAKTLKQLVLV